MRAVNTATSSSNDETDVKQSNNSALRHLNESRQRKYLEAK